MHHARRSSRCRARRRLFGATPRDPLRDQIAYVETALRNIQGLLDDPATKAYSGGHSSSKAAAIMAGVGGSGPAAWGDNYKATPFLAAIADARRGDVAANEYIKSVLGTSVATGTAVIPNNFVVATWSSQIAATNIYRGPVPRSRAA